MKGAQIEMFYDGSKGIVRVMAVAALAYLALLLLLRLSGKRALSKMNAFDLVVTVALGSTLGTVLLSKDVPLAEGIAAFAVLLALQFAVTWTSVRWPRFRRFVKSQPTLLAYNGSMLTDSMRRERVTDEEILAAARSAGISSLEDVAAVVLEPAGDLTVVGRPLAAERSTLSDVDGHERRPHSEH